MSVDDKLRRLVSFLFKFFLDAIVKYLGNIMI